MYCTIADFLSDWQEESAATEQVLQQLTPESLHQLVEPTGRSLGQLAWHLIHTLTEMPHHAGLLASDTLLDQSCPAAHELSATYANAAAELTEAVVQRWTDAQLREEVSMYGQAWTKAKVLSVLIRHQTHHRGQMTVLMRQAGLRVPGVYGPSREEWAAMGLPIPS